MQYDEQFERDFMRRTLQLIKEYKGPNDATILLNFLLGLLIVPKESSLEKIPLDPSANLESWGISPHSIKKFGAVTKLNPQPDTLRGIVWNLRNAVAHFRFKPIHKGAVVTGFEFSDKLGFEAVIDINEIQRFVEILADHLERQFAG